MRWIALLLLLGGVAGWLQAVDIDGQATILNDIHVVNSLEKTLAFYRDVFDLDGDTPSLANAGVAAMVNSSGARLRFTVLHLPNTTFGLELAEFSGVERKPGRAAISDPGAGTLVLRVRDLNRVVDAAKKSSAEIVTPSGAPVKLRPTSVGARAILMRDPDGYFVEGEEVSPSRDSPSSANVQSAGMRFAMADSNAARKFYGDLLGFKLTGRTEFSPNPAMSDFAGTPQETQLRALNVTARGTNPLVFYEFKDLPGAALPFRIHDPGAPAISFRVKDLDGLIRRLRAARTPIVSARGRAVQLVPESWSIFVRDPNGIYVELYEATR